VGTQSGHRALDQLARLVSGRPLPWGRFEGGFEMLVAATAPVFWVFFFLTGVALFILRWRDPRRERPFRVPLFPVIPLVFLATCAFMLQASIRYAGGLVVLSIVPLAFGYALWLISHWGEKQGAKTRL
jgi:amino acid transporter